MAYNSKYTGAEVDALLDKIKDDDVGNIDSSLSTTSEYPVMNKVITTELNKKATKTEVSSLSTTVTENKTATDTALSDLSAEVDEEVEALQSQLDSNGVLIEDLQESKADVSGYYPQLSVGLSDNLPDRGDIVEGAIGFRASAGEGNSIEDGVANVKELLGESVVWNQQCQFYSPQPITKNGLTFTVNPDTCSVVVSGTAEANTIQSFGPTSYIIKGHTYILTGCPQGGGTDTYNLFDQWWATDSGNGIRFTPSYESGERAIVIQVKAGVTLNNVVFTPKLIDLTLMFGAGNEPTTIEEFNAFCNQLVGVDLNAYNAGEVIGVHAKGFKSVNDNAWDEEWENGYFDNETGEPLPSTNMVRSKNFIPVLPNEDYFFGCKNAVSGGSFVILYYDANKNFIGFTNKLNSVGTTPSNAAYMKFRMATNYGTTYNHDICIRLAHSGYKTDYVAHEESEVSFDLSEYFPYGMHGIGEVRDSVTPSKATRRFGVVDLGTLNWIYDTTYASYNLRADVSKLDFKGSSTTMTQNLMLCSRYVTSPYTGIGSAVDKTIKIYLNIQLRVLDSAYTDAATFKAAMSGVYLYYELAEPIETEIDPMKNFSYEVWDFGTEEMFSDVPSMPVTTRTIYGFNATDTIRGNKAKNEEQDERLTTLENEVVRVGDYQPDLSVGVADQLAGHEDATPSEIGFRRSGGGAILDGNARIESIKGNSVVWNQPLDLSSRTITFNGVTFTVKDDGSVVANGTATAFSYIALCRSFETLSSHKYFIAGTPTGGSRNTYFFGNGVKLNDETGDGIIASGEDATNTYACRVSEGVTAENVVFRPKFYDLTKMFGAGNEPTTIEEFYARCPLGVDMNAYNEGEVIHMEADAIRSVGVNQWDEEWEEGGLALASGLPIALDGSFRSKNFIPIFPSIDYYITWAAYAGDKYVFFYDREQNFISRAFSSTNVAVHSPTNAAYCKIRIDGGMPFHNDICLNISDTEVNGEYFPYIAREQSLDIIGKYFPQGMKSAGTAHDEIRYNKTTQKWEAVKRICEVDMGSFRYGLGGTNSSHKRFQVAIADIKAVSAPNLVGNILCAKYITTTADKTWASTKGISVDAYGNVAIYDEAYNDDATTFKTAMSGVMLYYELAEPIVTEIDENINLDYEVWNVGTEQAIAEAPSAPLKADIIYGFNAYGVIKELLARVASLEAANASLASQLASVTSHNEEV